MTKLGYSGTSVFLHKTDNQLVKLAGMIVTDVEDPKKGDLIDTVILSRRFAGQEIGYTPVLMFDSCLNAFFIKSMKDGYPDELIFIGRVDKYEQFMIFQPAIDADTRAFTHRIYDQAWTIRDGEPIFIHDLNEPSQTFQRWDTVPVVYTNTILESKMAFYGGNEYIGFESYFSRWMQETGKIDKLIELFKNT